MIRTKTAPESSLPRPGASIDDINKRAMASRDAMKIYTALDELTPAERAILEPLRDGVRGRAILDIGVGGGRTARSLLAMSRDYVGIDYMPPMVNACRQRFPQALFDVADARDLSRFADAQFKLVVFGSNGLCMVGHDDRMQILREIYRVLADDGIFVFSTYNQRSAEHAAGFVFPDLVPTRNAARLAWRTLQWAKSSALGLYNRWRLSRHDVRGPEYSIINDRCHDFATMLYYVNVESQRIQLACAGFLHDAPVYGMAGLPVGDDTTDLSLTFAARKNVHLPGPP